MLRMSSALKRPSSASLLADDNRMPTNSAGGLIQINSFAARTKTAFHRCTKRLTCSLEISLRHKRRHKLFLQSLSVKICRTAPQLTGEPGLVWPGYHPPAVETAGRHRKLSPTGNLYRAIDPTSPTFLKANNRELQPEPTLTLQPDPSPQATRGIATSASYLAHLPYRIKNSDIGADFDMQCHETNE